MLNVNTGKIRLALNWDANRVLECLDGGKTLELVRFLRERHEERFFRPIRFLTDADGTEEGYGFAIMALCCLLIETIQCYRLGLPTSNTNELKELQEIQDVATPDRYKLDACVTPGSRGVFQRFFEEPSHWRFFPGLGGCEFYKSIRCGLLHQGQTKSGWLVRRQGKFWDDIARTLNRNEFAQRLHECFDSYIGELSSHCDWDGEQWKYASRKIWWLVKTSLPA
jgi:hypothetical protein